MVDAQWSSLELPTGDDVCVCGGVWREWPGTTDGSSLEGKEVDEGRAPRGHCAELVMRGNKKRTLNEYETGKL